MQVVLRAIQPYTRVRVPFIAQQLNVPTPDVEQLLISLILDGRVKGRIDQVNQVQPGCTGGPAWGRWRDCRSPHCPPPRLRPGSLSPPRLDSGSRPPLPAQLLELDAELEQGPKYSALDTWAAQLHALHATVAAKLAV